MKVIYEDKAVERILLRPDGLRWDRSPFTFGEGF
jgi:hypothetical protein